MMKPIVNKITPAISLPVPKLGWRYFVTFGEFKIVMGSETVQTQNIWNTQKPKNEKNLSRLSSKRSSLPVLIMRKRRKPESLAPQIMMKSESTIWRALWWPEKARVTIANNTKLVPPAKSCKKGQYRHAGISGGNIPVSLSNLREKAMEKKNSWYAIVIKRVMAR